MDSEFEVNYNDGEAVVTFCRPDIGNMLSLNGLKDLTSLIEGLPQRQPSVKVLRLRAQGKQFSLGRAPAPADAPRPVTSEDMRRRLIDPILALYRAIREWDMPVVAEVQGEAAGLGCALVAACDLAIAAESAKFSLPEMVRGLPPTLALSALGRKVHAKAAASMVWGLASLDANTALAVGLIGEVEPDDRLVARVDEVVANIVRQHPLALTTLKRYMRSLYMPDSETFSEFAGALLANALSSTQGGKEPSKTGSDEK